MILYIIMLYLVITVHDHVAQIFLAVYVHVHSYITTHLYASLTRNYVHINFSVNQACNDYLAKVVSLSLLIIGIRITCFTKTND